MSKASDASLRSSRQHLPTIAGSPSVGTSQHSKEREGVSAMSNVTVKDTPTKIPRMSIHRTPVRASPIRLGLNPSSTLPVGSRRTSLNIAGINSSQQSAHTQSRDTSPSGQSSNTNEFGMVSSSNETPKPQFAGASQSVAHRSSVRASPQSVSRVPRQSLVNLPITTGNSSSSSSAATPSAKKSAHPVSLSSLRKFSNNSTSFLSPKVNLPVTRVAESSRAVVPGTPSSSRQSLSTPSPLAAGAKREELDDMLKFPEPIPPKAGMTPADLLASSLNEHLCPYERKEVMDFERAYYIGQGSKKNMATLDNSTNNFGYDDERGDYLVIKHDHLAYRYEIIDTLGKGSFGQVLQCRDHCTGLSMGIKIIRNKKRFHHQALVEIKILENLKKWDPEEKSHVLKMGEYFTFRNHLCIVTELLSINLYELIKANGFAGFTTALIRRFTSQMLASLVLMRQHRIVHCDLKPENVLLMHPARSALKVIDFGSSCFEHEKVYTYIQSRFYRSPEVILGMNYHMAIDMWSLGCILAELYTGFPIFPGENEQEQLACIMEVLGVPDKDLVNRSSRKRLFFESNGQPRPVVNSKGRRRRPGSKTLAQVLRCDDELFVDFIAKCLIWDPERRIKPQPALRHPFITAGRRPKITSPAPGVSSRHLFTPSSLATSTMGEIPSDWPEGVPFYKWPPFPTKPEGVIIIPFSQFVATGLKADQDDGDPGVDQQGIQTIGLQARHDGDKKKRRRKKKNENGEVVEVPLAWWEELEEDTKNSKPLYKYDQRETYVDRLIQSWKDFSDKRRFPDHVKAVAHALGICLGTVDPNPNGVKTNKPKAGSDDAGSDVDDDFEEDGERVDALDAAPPPVPVTQDLYDADLKPETAREKAMDAFFQDPERVTKLFLTSYAYDKGIYWNEIKLRDTPILVEAYLNFLEVNEVFGASEKSTRFGIAQGKKIAQLAKEEMPHANKLANVLPDNWGKACGALWGQRLTGSSTWVFGQLPDEPTPAANVADTPDAVPPAQPVVTGDDMIFEPTDTELLVDAIEPPSINGVQTEWTNTHGDANMDASGDASGWGSFNAWGAGAAESGGWGGEGSNAGEGENAGENPIWDEDAFKEPPPPDPVTVWGNFAPSGQDQLEALIGPNNLAKTYVTLRVEISSRVIGTLVEPPANPTATPEGAPFADIVQQRFARLTLSPSRFLKTAPAYGACITKPDTMGDPIDESRFGWVGPHDPTSSDIYVFIPTDEDLLDVIRKGTGMTITGTFVQVAELAPPKEDEPAEAEPAGGEPPKKKKKKKGKKDPSAGVRSWWFLYQLTQVFPTFYEQ
ncbi:unnamed protein product [Rhizoctonia solani]|uniref:dual-specificity kinase n=1 Tax=Rhizoctonia solani TaxID=456999 RepID=A0A8H3HC36_9AGAM|nr:unnamed protein product [Rhizoctonia solani]